jgi:competence protein ComEA
MLRSLAVKLGLLAVTVCAVLWIGWPVPKPSEEPDISDRLLVAAEPAATDRTSLGREDLKAGVPGERPKTGDSRSAKPTPTRLDLNRASVDELQQLPGIGPVLAQRVVERRAKSGGFRSVDDLRRVKGIGAKRLERVKPLVTVDSSPPSPTRAVPERRQKL